MIWWHLLLTTLCAHAAFASAGDAIAALAPLHRSRVKVTQIFCSPKTIAVGVATGCRASFSSQRFFLPEQNSRTNRPKREMQLFLEITYSLICDSVFTPSRGLVPPPEVDVSRRQPPASMRRHLPFILTGSRNVSQAGSLPSRQPLHQKTVPHADHRQLNWSVCPSAPASMMHILTPWRPPATGLSRSDHLSGCACAVFQRVNTRVACGVHKSMNKS